MFVVIKVILDGISYRISHVYARMVLGLLSSMIVMYYSLPMISCAQRIFQYFSPCMGVFGYGVDPIDLFSFHTLSSYLAVCAVVQCLLTGTVMHIHAYCLHITLEGGNVTQKTGHGARRDHGPAHVRGAELGPRHDECGRLPVRAAVHAAVHATLWVATSPSQTTNTKPRAR